MIMKVCPNWQTCKTQECHGKQPHIENHECGLGHQPMTLWRRLPCRDSRPCIEIKEQL